MFKFAWKLESNAGPVFGASNIEILQPALLNRKLCFDLWLACAIDMICQDTRMLCAQGTLGMNNFMNIAGLLRLVRATKSLWTHNCGNSMSNRLSNSAFDDLPRDGP